MSSKVSVGIGTDPGRMREENQDATSFYLTDDGVWKLLILCDGMGGHAGGRQAALIASVEIGIEFADRVNSMTPIEALKESINAVNRRIYEQAQVSTEFRHMGTTCAVLAVANNDAYLAHVGDSRIYRIRHEAVVQVTKDHSYVQQMIDSGILSPEQANEHPNSNLLTRCIGARPDVEVDAIGPVPIAAGDRYLLCSDGLWGQVSAVEIAAMSTAFAAQDAVNRLINLANERGGPDNISAQIYHYFDNNPPSGIFSTEKFQSKQFDSDLIDTDKNQFNKTTEKKGIKKSSKLVFGFLALVVICLLMVLVVLMPSK